MVVLILKFNKAVALAAAAAAALSIAAAPASAQTQRTIKGERYVPTIWVDPDGCEHWVMDDGAEGFMSPHVTPDGKPVCRRGNICGVMPTDQFFATDKHYINAAGRKRLGEFFQQAKSNGARAFIVAGHTDSRASDEYNIRLSERRAHAVAQAGRSVGARIKDVRAYGERDPRVPNTSAGNMAQNRRVEIYCLR
ncbi:OmpA family protein [Leisingera sp. HS039]|uniref:OmpA family protein n=1 Tax=unclassified Leisingera TaxID=2614906 RepID=UPI001070C8E4|nr:MULTISPECIES: OmpA family protein [unclassified Leisingera]MBQ4825881.1 OmpA family protein [Leisingera sp. HS039]QBR34984.1 OmpA family protein [Leisingera sp. NJS201]UWQ30860.1 OmpA family protein [Leisingera sp. M523]